MLFCLQLRLAAKRIYVNLMVCGMSGLGKTTGIQNMLASYFPDEQLKHDGSATSFKAFEHAPDSPLTVTPAVDVPETRTEVVYSIQDTPGCDHIACCTVMQIAMHWSEFKCC